MLTRPAVCAKLCSIAKICNRTYYHSPQCNGDRSVVTQIRLQGNTPNANSILDAVCQLGEHVTPEAVYDHVHRIAPTLSRATVDRVLHFLTEQRILAMDAQYDFEIDVSHLSFFGHCTDCRNFTDA